LLCCSSQKHKYKKSNLQIGFPTIGYIGESCDEEGKMSGWKFYNILCQLHCCPVKNQDQTAEDYDPSYKVVEVQDYLQDRYIQLFILGQQLSLDKTLICAFGQIKFKVRIVTKAARYSSIKDATTAFILWVVIYTGKTTYYANSESQAEKLKMVQ
jgi:hypothetical protein